MKPEKDVDVLSAPTVSVPAPSALPPPASEPIVSLAWKNRLAALFTVTAEASPMAFPPLTASMPLTVVAPE